MQNTHLLHLEELYTQIKEEALADYFTFLRFKSISSEKEYIPEMNQCITWLKNYIQEIGLDTEIWQTEGHPILFASHLKAGPGRPTILIYNHYDVQPVDPLELWNSPPFDPTERNGEIYARGAQDNKGQCFYVLQALKLLLKKEKNFPINVKLVIEGEEEVGSLSLSKIIKKKSQALQADILAIVDVGIAKADVPSVVLGVRGIITMDVELTGSNIDLHSGFHGGIVYNPLHALVEILAKLRDEEGRVTVPGFYENVKTISLEEKQRLLLSFDATSYHEDFEAQATGGEKAFSPLERAWVRPTLEVNGIWGGYIGKGFKTVIPAKAYAKLSCRLVPDQKPENIASLVSKYLYHLAPPGIEVKVNIHEGVGEAVRSDIHSPGLKAFLQAYEEVFKKPIAYTYAGGSIPIVHELQAVSGTEVVFVGLGLPTDAIHAPNEHFGIDRLKKGALIFARAIELIGSHQTS